MLYGIVIGEASSPEKAEELAEKYKDCPYLIVEFTNSNKIYSVLAVPDENEWWLKYPEINPEVVGYKRAKVFISDKSFVPEKFEIRVPEVRERIAPCGADCGNCNLKKEYKCKGCPATIYYGK